MLAGNQIEKIMRWDMTLARNLPLSKISEFKEDGATIATLVVNFVDHSNLVFPAMI